MPRREHISKQGESYTLLNWIYSSDTSSTTSHVKTGYILQENYIKVECKVRWIQSQGSIFGARNDTTGTEGIQFQGYRTNVLRFYDGRTTFDKTYNYVNIDLNLTLEVNNGYHYINVNGSTSSTTNNNLIPIYCGKELYLFASNRGSVQNPNPGSPFYGKIYWMKFYERNNLLVRDFVPVIRDSDNKLGMLDYVNDEFHECVGNFTYE